MASIEDEPTRLDRGGEYKRLPLPVLRLRPLSPPLPLQYSLVAALANRRSAEHFTPIATQELGTWLHYIAAIHAINSDDSNRQRRFVASFGALHPAHILIGTPNNEWSVYLPKGHALGELKIDLQAARQLRTRAQQCHATPTATLIALLSDRDLAENYYANPRALILRDAGVLFGHAALVAAGLGLAFRILGSTGAAFAESLVPEVPFRPVGAGLAWIGGCGSD